MADAAGEGGGGGGRFRGGFGGERRGRGRDRGERGERRGGRRGDRGPGRRRGRDGDKSDWVPVTKLGRLVKAQKIKTLEDIYLFSLAVKEYQIVEAFLGPQLVDEVMKISPVQKQTKAGQRTRFKAFVVVGDSNGHLGLGVKCSKEVTLAIRGAIIAAKLAVIPVRRGYWGVRFGAPHTVPCKVSGSCGSVRMRLVPAPRGTGIVAAKAPKKVLSMAGIADCYTRATGHRKTMGNFIKSTYYAIAKTYGYLTPDLWAPTVFYKSPFQEHTDFLKDTADSKSAAKKLE